MNFLAALIAIFIQAIVILVIAFGLIAIFSLIFGYMSTGYVIAMIIVCVCAFIFAAWGSTL